MKKLTLDGLRNANIARAKIWNGNAVWSAADRITELTGCLQQWEAFCG